MAEEVIRKAEGMVLEEVGAEELRFTRAALREDLEKERGPALDLIVPTRIGLTWDPVKDEDFIEVKILLDREEEKGQVRLGKIIQDAWIILLGGSGVKELILEMSRDLREDRVPDRGGATNLECEIILRVSPEDKGPIGRILRVKPEGLAWEPVRRG